MTPPQIAGFDILELVREGGVTVTWRARQRSLERTVCVRMLRPEATAEQRANYATVARALANVKHPGLIQVIDVLHTDDDTPLVVLEAVEGPTLKELLRAETQIAPTKAARIGAAIADALDAAWQQARLVHRNLKPEDIVLTAAGDVKILEFSAATPIRPDVDPLAHDGGLIVGTPAYMAPEQAQGSHALDFHADIYGLGALLYHLVTGVAPFAFEADYARVMELQVTGSLPSTRLANPRIPAALDSVIARCMMKDPQARYACWSDVVAALQRIHKGQPLPRGSAAPAYALSTVAPYVAPPRRPRVRAAGGGSGAARVSACPSGGPSAGTRLLLWLLLGIALAALAIHRWGHLAPAAPTLAEAPSATPQAPPAAPPAAAPGTEVAPPSVHATAPAASPAAASATASALAPALVAAVTDALRREDRAAARAVLVDAAGRTPAEHARAAALRAIDGAVTTDDIVGIRLLEQHRGRPVRINFRGRELTVVPDRYVAGLASGEMLMADGSRRPWAVRLSELSTADRLRLLGTPAGAPDPEADAAIALLAIAGDDATLMRRMAERVPALAPFLLQAADAL